MRLGTFTRAAKLASQESPDMSSLPACLTLACALVLGCSGDASTGDASTDTRAADTIEDTAQVSADGVLSDADTGELAADTAVLAPVTIVSTSRLAPAPADLIFARLVGRDLGREVRVDGVLRDRPLLVDRDAIADPDDFPFAAFTLDADGNERYRTTLREPIQIREFLDTAPLPVGFEPFDLFPQLGDFVVRVPRDPLATTLVFTRRELDGTTTNLGSFVLAELRDLAVDDPSPLDAAPSTRIAGPDDPEGVVDIAILGDGYTADEMATFHADAERLVAEFMALAPFSTYAGRFAFHRIDTPSVESGAGFDCGTPEAASDCRDAIRETAFQSVFPLRVANISGLNVEDRVVFQLRLWEVWRAAARAPFDATVVLVNTPKYGAFGIHHATGNAPRHDLQAVVHEFGHSFALLGDEYVNPGDSCQDYPLSPLYPNIARPTTDPAALPWAEWVRSGVTVPTPPGTLSSGDVGGFEGAGGNCPDYLRPQDECFMRATVSSPFCAVCKDVLVRRLFRHIDVLRGPGVELDGHTLTARTQPGIAVEASWELDGQPAGSAEAPLVLPISEGGERTHEVTLRVRHTTDDVRIAVEQLEEVVRLEVRVRPVAR